MESVALGYDIQSAESLRATAQEVIAQLRQGLATAKRCPTV
jgi:hypothetical protein